MRIILLGLLLLGSFTAMAFELAATADPAKVQLGCFAGTAVKTRSVVPPSGAWKFPQPDGSAAITLKNIPDWGKEGFTAEIWCKPNSSDCGYAMLMRGSFGFPKFIGGLAYDHYLVTADNGNPGGRIYTGVQLGEYQYYAMTGSAVETLFYLNKNVMRKNAGCGIPAWKADNLLYIGNSIGWATKNFDGEVALIRLYNRVLSGSEIAENVRCLHDNQPLPSCTGLIYAVDRRETGSFWQFSGDGHITVSDIHFSHKQGLEVNLTLLNDSFAPGQLLELGDMLSVNIDAEGAVSGQYAGTSFSAAGILQTGRLNKLTLLCNGDYLQLLHDNTATGNAVPVNKVSLPETLTLTVGQNFSGILGKISIGENRTLPDNLGQTITRKLDNHLLDKFSYSRSRHIQGKPEKGKPLVDFEDISGWTVSYTVGAVEPVITRSQEEPLWGEYVLRTEFRKGDYLPSDDTKVVLAPPRPIPITDDFDAVNIWRFATSYSSANRPKLSYSLQFRNAEGKLHSTGPMGGMLEVGWGIHHMPLSKVKAPAEFISVIFTGFNESKRVTYFDSLRFYTRSKAAIVDADVPDWKNLGVPIRPETILPTAVAPATTSLQKKGAREWRFTAVNTKGQELIFDILPSRGTLDDISATYKNKTFHPLTGGGFHWAENQSSPVAQDSFLAPGHPDVQATFLGASSVDNKLILHWQYKTLLDGNIRSQWILELKDNSLIVDLNTDKGCVGEFQFGAVTGISGKVIEVPYLSIGSWIHRSFSPGIFVGDGGIFISALIDWYNSDASGLFGESSARPGGYFELNQTTADHRWVADPDAGDPTNIVRNYSIINGGSYYWPTTAGKRNPVRERFFLTVTDQFDATLPNIPNPTHHYLQETAKDVWSTRMWYVGKMPCMDFFDRELAMWKLCKAYGMDELNVRLHGNINRQYIPRRTGEPSTFIEDFVEPGIGGNAKCTEFFREMQKLGYRIGHYTDHMLLNPLAYEAWDEDMLNLDSNSRWLYSSGNCKQTKISRMVALQKKYNGYLRRDFSPNCAYLDQITCPPPWRYTDYDARVPDAGKFSAAYRVFIASLRQEEQDFGPVLSEGKTQLYFAGICDSYAQPQRMDMNVIPNFNLRKLHTLSNDCGYELSLLNWKGSGIKPEIGVYRTLAYQYAYGNTAHIYGPYHGEPYDKELPPFMLQSYFLIQPLQQYYALTPVKDILYHIHGDLAPVEEAIAAGTLANNQIKIIYQNNLEVAANLHREENFAVRLHGQDFLLPPDGFAASLPGKAEVFSTLINGKRKDFLWTAEIEYTDGGNTPGTISGQQAYILRKSEKELRLTPAPFVASELVTVDLQHIPGWENVQQIHLYAYGRGREFLNSSMVAVHDGKFQIDSNGSAFSYQMIR